MSDKKIDNQKKAIHCKNCLSYDKYEDKCLLRGIKKCSAKCEFSKCEDFKYGNRFTMF